jgi:hypothetical protein
MCASHMYTAPLLLPESNASLDLCTHDEFVKPNGYLEDFSLSLPE